MPKQPRKPGRAVKAAPSKGTARTPRAARGGSSKTEIAAHTHRDKRLNIPTEELRDFVREDEQKKVARYPRNPDLDPQLVWRGKDEQDAKPLEVLALPVYIQEKIHPQAIIDDFRRTAPKAKTADVDEGPGLFDHYAAFNGLPEDFAQRVDFYQHQGHWSNRLILGDSLLVMTSLAEKEGLKGRVQCVYFDPPYGIKFGSNWQVSTRKRDVKDGKAEDVVRQPEQMRAFRDTWALGIHSYLAYIRDRLAVSLELLTETGSIFVQIGDENVHLVRSLMDEVFGSENFVALIPFRKKTMPLGTSFIEQMSDFLIWYGKTKDGARSSAGTKYRQLFLEEPPNPDSDWSWYELPDRSRHKMTADQIQGKASLPNQARVYRLKSLEPSGTNESGQFNFPFEGKTYKPPRGGWGTDEKSMTALAVLRRLQPKGELLNYVLFFDDYPVSPLTAPWSDTVGPQDKRFVVQTSDEVVQRCMLMTTDPGDLVLDPTCGSGTTAFVAERWGRRWITTDTSRVALTLARTRLMAARFPYYIPADSPDGRALERELAAADPAQRESVRMESVPAGAADANAAPDIRRGFIYKRVPHVTLKSIANNPDIKDGMTREQIDAAIARHADTELLFDKPFEDNKRLRVTGPFTVESLSPHRTISLDQRRRESGEGVEGVTCKVVGPDDFGRLVLDNMKRSGVQNTFKGEKMVLETLDPHPGEWIQGVGTYTDKGGKAVRVAVCIGPEHGTVGPELVKEAAKEAVQGVGFDTLLVAGFAFDPHVGEEAKRYGKLTVLSVRINADLGMGELLKKTGAGNLFMIFGEPDIDIRPVPASRVPAAGGKPGAPGGDQIEVEIKGLDVYDPTTGEVRSSSKDDIACWFIDTDYNGESFFVRHAYFTGADEPYDKLKRALRAEVDEGAWSALYTTVSRPFPKPKGAKGKGGRIAVKVINHFGDEVMKVFGV